jgi:A/G-specific adenine glycosylase
MLPDRDALLRWYDRVRRPLPWRATRDPYALLVSEVMLQQTQAARVVPYYEAFLARFPDAAALAAAPARDVLAAWSGLGYNRRALALQAAARAVAAEGWPEDLTRLPGVGPYTAAAVGSFAWDRQVAAVDTNVTRVISRWDGAAPAGRALAGRAAEWLPRGRAAEFNQAMMELGATVCTARAPRCGECPLAPGCAAAAAGGPRVARCRASRTPTAGRVAGSSLRSWPARRCRRSRPRAASARSPGSSATGSSSVRRTAGCASRRSRLRILAGWTGTRSSGGTSRSAAADTTPLPWTRICARWRTR